MKFYSILAASFISFAGVSSSFAADVVPSPIVATTPMPIYSAYNFNGLYAGVQLGGRWFNQDVNIDNIDYSNNFADANGFLGGLYLGYNYQFSNSFIAGIETDIAFAGSSGTKNYTDAASGTNLNHTLEEKWNGATRLRLGYAADRFMPYIAGGISYNAITNSLAGMISNEDGFGYQKDTKTGYTFGAGLDYAVTDNMLLRLEYRYSNYGSQTEPLYDDVEVPSIKTEQSSNDVRVGVAYKF